MKNFDPIDILFICLISCYLVTFIAIIVLLSLKYKDYKKKNVEDDKDNLERFEEVLATPITKNKKIGEAKPSKKTTVPKKTVNKKSQSTKKGSSSVQKTSSKKKTSVKKSTNKSVATKKANSSKNNVKSTKTKSSTKKSTSKKTANKKSTQK